MTSQMLRSVLAITVGLLGVAALPACGRDRSVGAPQSSVSEVELGESRAQATDVGNSDLQTTDKPQIAEDSRAGNTDETLLISPRSMGPARLGMTVGELRQTGLVVGEPQAWISDFDALPVSDGDEVLFLVVYGSWEVLEDSTPIEYLVTENPKMMTPEGIGPGSSIGQAEAVYGRPTLAYNIETHSREGVQFEGLPWNDYTFEPAVPGDPEGFAGIYDDSETGTYFETGTYRDDAVIGSILIDTREQ